MTKSELKRGGVVMLLTAALLAGASPVFAGFEWKSPAASSMPAPDMTSPATTAPQNIEWDTAPLMPAEKVPGVETTPLVTGKMAPLGEIVSGFGSQLPLVIALQQIVPPGYQYSFATGVNPGTVVSWEGGKTWQMVLAEMLSAQNLEYQLHNNTIVVSPASREAHIDMVPMSPPEEKVSAEAMPVAPPSAPVAQSQEKPARFMDRFMRWGSAEQEIVKQETPKQETVPLPPVNLTDVSPVEQATPVMEPQPPAMEPAPPVVAKSVEQPLSLVEPPPPSVAEIAAPSPEPVVMPLPPAITWQAEKGRTLKAVLAEWTQKAGVKLHWSIDYDYLLNASISSSGSFDEAVGDLFNHFSRTKPQPYGHLYQGGSGPRVLMVKAYSVSR